LIDQFILFVLHSLRLPLQLLHRIRISIEAINLPCRKFFMCVSHHLLLRLLPGWVCCTCYAQRLLLQGFSTPKEELKAEWVEEQAQFLQKQTRQLA